MGVELGRERSRSVLGHRRRVQPELWRRRRRLLLLSARRRLLLRRRRQLLLLLLLLRREVDVG